MVKNVQEMVVHGGMGDAKAIVHLRGEAARYAETDIKQLSASGSGVMNTVISLNEAIRHCRRVLEIGVHADPDQLLNPATKNSCRCPGIDAVAWVDEDELRLDC